MLKSFLRNSIGLTILQGTSLLVPVLLIPIIVNVQGIAAYGEYATVIAYFFFAGLICDYGFDYSAVRHLKLAQGDETARAITVRETMSAKCLLYVVGSPLVAISLMQFAGMDDVLLVASGLLMPLVNVTSVHWIYLAESRLVSLVAPIGLARIASLVAVALTYPLLPSIAFVIVLTTVPIVVVQSVFLLSELRRSRSGGNLSVQAGVRALRAGRSASYVTFLSSYMAMSSVVALSFFASPRDLGMFAAIERVAKAAFGIAKPFLVALYPEMASFYQESRRKWDLVIVRVVLVAIVFGTTSIVTVALWWNDLSIVLLGQVTPRGEWIASGFAAWLMIGLINNALGIQGLVASGHEGLYARGLTLATGMLTISYLVLGAMHGALGIVVAMLIAELALFFLNMRAFLIVRTSNA